MPVITSNGSRIHWDQSGQGTPLLLIMGHRYSSAMWYPLIEGLGDRYRLIWFDNQGTGKSEPRRRTSVAEMASDALAVMDAADVESAHVYGVSMGGGIALEFGIRYPERARSLILGCTMAKTPEFAAKRSWLAWLAYRLPKPVLKALSSKKFKRGYGDAAADALIERDLAMADRDAFSRKGVWAQAVAISDYSVDPADVAAVQLPALVLHGTQDLVVPYEQGAKLAGMLPDARLVTFQDIGHNYFVGEGERANAEVDSFIKAVEAGR